MNKSSKLLVVIVTLFLLVSLSQVECRRTYSSRSSSSGRGNRGKNQPSSGGLFSSSWFGGGKTGSSSSSGSGSISKPVPTSAKKNWQTATSHASSPSKSDWANPHYKPASAPLPSAPKETYGWKPSSVSNPKPGSAPYPSSNIGSRGYPVQSGVQSQSNFGGFKPVSNTNYQPSSAHSPGHSTGFGGYQPSASVPNSAYKPSNTYQPSHGFQPSHASVPSSGYHPPSTGYHSSGTGYHPPATGYHPSGTGYHPSGTGYHAPSTGYHAPSSGYHPSSYPQQSHYPSQSFSGYPAHSSFGSSVPSYQGNKLFGGSSGSYGYPGSGSWGVPVYGAKKSSGTGKLLTGLAVGAAGGYLTSSLVHSISNPWKYSGYGYGSRYGYDSGLGGGYGSSYGLTRDQSAFERGYERGARDRNENNKEAPAPAVATPTKEDEDPTSKWINCVAFDPQTQNTLINPNCSCTVTTSIDERTGQPISVHQCTTLNGLVLKPIPLQPNFPISSGVNGQPSFGVNGQPSFGVNGQPSFGVNGQPPTGVNAPGAVPLYGGAYQDNSQYGAMSGVYLPSPSDPKNDQSMPLVKTEGSSVASVAPDTKTEAATLEAKTEESSKGIVATSEVIVPQNFSNVESVTLWGNDTETSPKSPMPLTDKETTGEQQGAQEAHKGTAEFYSKLQKIVNMGNFVDGL